MSFPSAAALGITSVCFGGGIAEDFMTGISCLLIFPLLVFHRRQGGAFVPTTLRSTLSIRIPGRGAVTRKTNNEQQKIIKVPSSALCSFTQHSTGRRCSRGRGVSGWWSGNLVDFFFFPFSPGHSLADRLCCDRGKWGQAFVNDISFQVGSTRSVSPRPFVGCFLHRTTCAPKLAPTTLQLVKLTEICESFICSSSRIDGTSLGKND